MNKFISFVSLALFLSFPSILFAAETGDKALFVLLSKEASMKATASGYELILKGVNPTVTYFSNRPARISGQIPTAKFAQQWTKGGFSRVSPNAMIEAVTFKSGDHLQKSYAVILSKAKVISQNEMRFEVKALPGYKTALSKFAKTEYVALFVDDVCMSCIIN